MNCTLLCTDRMCLCHIRPTHCCVIDNFMIVLMWYLCLSFWHYIVLGSICAYVLSPCKHVVTASIVQNALCDRYLQAFLLPCYAEALLQTCNSSAADINALIAFVYNYLKFSGHTSCTLGQFAFSSQRTVSGKSLHLFVNNFNKFKFTFYNFCHLLFRSYALLNHLKLIFKIYLPLSIANVIMTS